MGGDGVSQDKEVQMAQAVRALTENMKRPVWIDMVNCIAREKFAKFQAYQRAGFDAKQALELVIREGGQ